MYSQTESAIASHLGKLLRDTFGRGPQSIYVNTYEPFIVVYLRNFLMPMEKILLQQEREHFVQKNRDIVMQHLITEIKASMSIMMGIQIQEFYYDWALDNQSGVFVWVKTDVEQERREEIPLQENYYGRDRLHEEIELVTQLAYKPPARLYSCKINARTLLIVREGILVDIEKELMRLGSGDLLKAAKRTLENKYFHNHHQFGQILHATITDAFTDWNFQLDKSVSIFILNPSP